MSILLVSEPASSVVTLTLNRPEKKNALSIALRDAVSDALGALGTDERVKVVVLTGAGDAFCAGFDLKEFAPDDPPAQRRLWESSDRFHHAVLRFPLPLVAAVNGPALAGGFDLAVLCDLRIASDAAYFAHPEHSFSDIVYAPLHDLVGGAVARDLALTGRRVSAPEALALRLVSRVVPVGDLTREAESLARTIAGAPRHALVRTKAKAVARAGIPAATPTLDL